MQSHPQLSIVTQEDLSSGAGYQPKQTYPVQLVKASAPSIFRHRVDATLDLIGEQGISLHTREAFEVGTKINMDLFLIASRMTLVGTVSDVVPHNLGYQVNLELEEPVAAFMAFLQVYEEVELGQ